MLLLGGKSPFFDVDGVWNGGKVVASLRKEGQTLPKRRKTRALHTSKKLQDTHRILFCHFLSFTSASDSFCCFISVYLGRKVYVISVSLI